MLSLSIGQDTLRLESRLCPPAVCEISSQQIHMTREHSGDGVRSLIERKLLSALTAGLT